MPDSIDSLSAPRVALIGFGEAGEKFARSANWRGRACGWDLLPERRELMADYDVATSDTAAGALSNFGVLLSLVTADAALAAAREYAPLLPGQSFWCDMNSVSPGTKREAAAVVEAAGGRYVDVAVMAPVDAALAVPLLLSGPHCAEVEPLLKALGFSNVRIVGDEIGKASAIKMIRSVMVKGIEALSAECSAAAHAAGVYEEVIASLDASERRGGWADRIEYNLGRMELHGLRRAVEMEESAHTLEALGVTPTRTRGTVEVQRRTAKSQRE
jgi:3-hydroxyisobutyrate dehydrogenase-like beta-hydroxyacid dehydrogenase